MASVVHLVLVDGVVQMEGPDLVDLVVFLDLVVLPVQVVGVVFLDLVVLPVQVDLVVFLDLVVLPVQVDLVVYLVQVDLVV